MLFGSVPGLRLLDGHQATLEPRLRDFSALGHGFGDELGVRDPQRSWEEDLENGLGEEQDGEESENGGVDIGFEEFFEVLKEDPPQQFPASHEPQGEPNFALGLSDLKQDHEMAPTTPAIPQDNEPLYTMVPSFLQQEQQMAPHTPAIPEQHHQVGMSAPSANLIVPDLFWPPDLNESGDGLVDTSAEEIVSMESPNELVIHQFPELSGPLDHDRPKQTNDSVLASNWIEERSSPDVSKTSGSNSSSPIALVDGYNGSNELRFMPSVKHNGIAKDLRLLRVDSGPHLHPVVDLTSDSDSDEEESELQDLTGISLGKRRLPSWAEMNPKRSRESAAVNWPPKQLNGYQFPSHPPGSSLVKPEFSSVSNRSLPWNPTTAKIQMESGRWDPSGSSLKAVAVAEAHSNLMAYRSTHSMNITQRSSSGEMSTSYDRTVRALPPSLGGSISGLASGGHIVVAPNDGSSAMKRSEELAYQAVLQAFSLADEKDETTPDEGLLAMSLLKHQKIALSWMVKRESGRQDPCGGILADDQGLGKTISTIALILKNRAPIQKEGLEASQVLRLEGSTVDLDDDEDNHLHGKKEVSKGKPLISNGTWPTSLPSISSSPQQLEDPKSAQASNKGRPAAGTLVICPTSVLRQWAQEIRDKVTAEADLSVLVYHGSNRTRDPQELAKYDVVLSTYSIVSMEVPKQPLPEEKDEENKRNPYDYGFVPFTKPKKEKSEKPKKAKAKGRGRLAEGQSDPSIPLDSGPLARVAWFRVVLDEAQSIKNCRTQVARAAWGLRAKRRWCLSGTPIQNTVDDLFSYFRFLRYFPWDAYKKFRYDIKDPVVRNPSEGYRKLQAILKPIVLRRTKRIVRVTLYNHLRTMQNKSQTFQSRASLIDGKPIVNLPARIVKLKQAEFSIDERSFYTNLEAESRAQFQVYAAAGTVQSNYVNILWMLLRLRQACDHPMLVKKCLKTQAAHKTALDSVRKLAPEQRFELIQCLEGSRAICHICQDAPEEPVVSICSHVFCRQCISEQMANGDDTTCRYPKCRRPLNSSLLYTLTALKDPGMGNGNSSSNSGSSLVVAAKEEDEPGWKTSSKIDAVISTLQALPRIMVLVEGGKILKGLKAEKALEAEKLELDVKNPESAIIPVTSGTIVSAVQKVDSTEKAIVFSQWTSMLDLLETPLKHAGLCYRRLDGTMSVLARDRAVSDFNTLPEVTVMIMSLKAASLGLNMVAACHVLLLDVWWNPTTEDQAIDRAHRIGQTRTVNVSRFTVKNTIEDRILALQDRKRQIVASAFGEHDGGEQKTRLTVEDLRYLFRV